MRSALILLLLILLFSLAARGQQVIRGRVADLETGEFLPGANIYLLDDWQTGASSGIDGAFEFRTGQRTSPDDTVIISFVGFEELRIPLKDWVEETVYLVPVESKLTEIVVRSSALIAEEFQYEKISKIDIYTNPAAKADPILAVNSLPSATPADESANISLRGGNPGQTGVFFNDVPIYDYVKFSQLNGIGVFSIFNTAIVEALSVFPGNPPLEYGNVSGGMITISSDEQVAAVSTNSLTVSPASFGYFRQQRISEKMSLSFFGNYQPGGILKVINGDAIRGVDRFNLIDGGIYLFAKPGERSMLKIFNYSLSESYRFNFRSASYNGFFSQKRKRNFTTFKWRQQLSEQGVLSINSGLSFSDADFSYSQFVTHTRGRDLFLGVNYQHTGEKAELKGGWSSDHRYQQAAGISPQYGYALAAGHPMLSFETDDGMGTDEAFVYLKLFPSDRFTIGGGMRAGGFMGGDFYLAEQLNAKWDFHSDWSVVIGVGQYHQVMRQLSFERDFTRIVSEQLSADLQWNVAGIKGSLSLFGKINSGDPALENTIRGIEIFFERNVADRLSYNISGSYLVYDKEPRIGDNQPGNINYFLRSNLNWNFSGRWTLGANILYREGSEYFPVDRSTYQPSLEVYVPVYAENRENQPDYFSAGLSLSNELALNEHSTMIVFASVNNLTDHWNVRAYSYNTDYSQKTGQLFGGRTIYFGFVFRF